VLYVLPFVMPDLRFNKISTTLQVWPKAGDAVRKTAAPAGADYTHQLATGTEAAFVVGSVSATAH
jgi:hypothetical protein